MGLKSVITWLDLETLRALVRNTLGGAREGISRGCAREGFPERITREKTRMGTSPFRRLRSCAEQRGGKRKVTT